MISHGRRNLLISAAAAVGAGALSRDAWIRRALAGNVDSIAGSEWDYRATTELVEALQARRISSLELTERVIARIEALDQRLNAVVVRDFDRARATIATQLLNASEPLSLVDLKEWLGHKHYSSTRH